MRIRCLYILLLLGGAVAFARTAEEIPPSYEEGRRALSDEAYEKAVRYFQEALSDSIKDEIADDALYWKAFALYRQAEELRSENRREALDRARETLELLRERYPNGSALADAKALEVRLKGMMARRGDAQAARELLQQAQTEEIGGEEATRLAALQALVMMDPARALPLLKDILKKRSEEKVNLRRQAVYLLAHTRLEDAEAAMIELLPEESDPKIRADMLQWLGAFGTERSLDVIVQEAKTSEGPDELQAVILALAHNGSPRATEMLMRIASDENQNEDFRLEAIMALSRCRPVPETPKLKQLFAQTQSAALKEALLYALASTAELSWLFAIIADTKEPVGLRSQAVHLLARKHHVDGARLAELYGTAEKRELKEAICYALTLVNDEESLTALIDIARREQDEDLRRALIYWIGQFDDPRAADFLVEIAAGD